MADTPAPEAPVLEEEAPAEDAIVQPLTPGSNQFVPWIPSLQTNMTGIAAYIGDSRTANGVVAGVADPLIYNRAVHQGAFVAAALAQFVANAGFNVMDDGSMSLATFVTNLTSALTAGGGSIANSQLAAMPTHTVKANNTAGSASPTDVPYATLLAAMGVVIPTQGHYQQQTTSTGGAGAWVARPLDTADGNNNITGASLSGGQVTLPQGRYKVWAYGHCQSTSTTGAMSHKLRVRDATHAVTLVEGINTGVSISSTAGGVIADGYAQGVFVLASASAIEIDSYATQPFQTMTTIGSGEPDVATDVLFEKVA